MADSYSAIQALQTQIRQTNSALTMATATAAAAPMVSGNTITFIPPVLVFSGATQTSWTTVTGTVPAGAKFVILDGHFVNTATSGTDAYFYVRANVADSTGLFLGYTANSVNSDQSSHAAQGWFPVNSDGSFQWSTNTGNMGCKVRIIGYVQ